MYLTSTQRNCVTDDVNVRTCCQLDAFVNKHYVTENAALIGIGIDQLQLSGLTRRMVLRPSAPPPDTSRKAKVPPPPDTTAIPNKFHAGTSHIAVDS